MYKCLQLVVVSVGTLSFIPVIVSYTGSAFNPVILS